MENGKFIEQYGIVIQLNKSILNHNTINSIYPLAASKRITISAFQGA